MAPRLPTGLPRCTVTSNSRTILAQHQSSISQQSSSPSIRIPTAPTNPQSSSRRTFSTTPSLSADIIRRPRRPYAFTQMVQLSDGSTYTMRTASPMGMYKSTKDTRNHILWQPTDKSLRNVEVDEAGRLAAFRGRFGRDFDAYAPPVEEEEEAGGQAVGAEVVDSSSGKKDKKAATKTTTTTDGKDKKDKAAAEEKTAAAAPAANDDAFDFGDLIAGYVEHQPHIDKHVIEPSRKPAATGKKAKGKK